MLNVKPVKARLIRLYAWNANDYFDGWRLCVLSCPACRGGHLLSLGALNSYDEWDNLDGRITYSCPDVATSDAPVTLLDDELDAVRKHTITAIAAERAMAVAMAEEANYLSC